MSFAASFPVLDDAAPVKRATAEGRLIADVATRLGVTTRALRFYEDQALFSVRRGRSGERRYDADAVAAIEAIVELRNVDVPLDVIASLLALGIGTPRYVQESTAVLKSLMEQRARELVAIDDLMKRVRGAAQAKPVSPRQADAGASDSGRVWIAADERARRAARPMTGTAGPSPQTRHAPAV